MLWNCFYWEVAPFISPSSDLPDSAAQGKLSFPHSFVLRMSSSCRDAILTVGLSFGRSAGAHTCKHVLSPSAHRWGDGGVVFMAQVPLGSLQSARLPRGQRWAVQVACLNSSIQQAQFTLPAWASPFPETEVNMALRMTGSCGCKSCKPFCPVTRSLMSTWRLLKVSGLQSAPGCPYSQSILSHTQLDGKGLLRVSACDCGGGFHHSLDGKDRWKSSRWVTALAFHSANVSSEWS